MFHGRFRWQLWVPGLVVLLLLSQAGCSGANLLLRLPRQPGLAAPTSVATPSPVAVPDSLSGWSGQDIAAIGQRRVTGGMAITVVRARKEARAGTIEARPGYVYWVAEVLLENVSATRMSFSLVDFRAQDAAGFIYAPSLASPAPGLTAGLLTPGEKARGNVAFLVRSTAQDVVLIYRPVAVAGAEPVWVALMP